MSTDIHTPHDRLFKHCWSTKAVAKDFLKSTLPGFLLQAIDLDTLEPCSEMLVDAQLAAHIVDVIYRVNFNGKPGSLPLS